MPSTGRSSCLEFPQSGALPIAWLAFGYSPFGRFLFRYNVRGQPASDWLCTTDHFVVEIGQTRSRPTSRQHAFLRLAMPTPTWKPRTSSPRHSWPAWTMPIGMPSTWAHASVRFPCFATSWPKASCPDAPGPPRTLVPPVLAPSSIHSWEVAAECLPSAPYLGQSQSPAWQIALHACPREHVQSLRARTHPPLSTGPCRRACPASRAPVSLSLAWPCSSPPHYAARSSAFGCPHPRHGCHRTNRKAALTERPSPITRVNYPRSAICSVTICVRSGFFNPCSRSLN